MCSCSLGFVEFCGCFRSPCSPTLELTKMECIYHIFKGISLSEFGQFLCWKTGYTLPILICLLILLTFLAIANGFGCV